MSEHSTPMTWPGCGAGLARGISADERGVKVERFFAACAPDDSFSLYTIHKKKSAIRVTPSDRKYGGMTVKRVVMMPFEGEIPEGLTPEETWKRYKLAWIWQNDDKSFWMDSLSISQAEASAWSSSPERSIRLGMAVIPVQFSLG
jgi:hypothetical protein